MEKKKRVKKSVFITFEGLEGSGKSSVINFLARHLRKKGLSVKTFREPGSTRIGEEIRQLLLDKRNNISPHTELLLYLAARTQLIEEKIWEAFKNYDVVICDRFYDSTIAYQGYGLKLGRLSYEATKKFSLGVNPDLTILLDSNVKKALGRLSHKDRIESRPLSFHYRLKKGYRKIAKKEPRRVKVVRADKELGQICEDVKNLVEKFFQKKDKKYKK